jgi:hypothetical protein
MPTNTYVALDKKTLTSTVQSVTFTSIPSTYTDLVLVVTASTNTAVNSFIRINGDNTANYSATRLYGNGTTASSSRYNTETFSYTGDLNTSIGTTILHFQNYANATTVKSFLSQDTLATSGGGLWSGVWRKTPLAAITEVEVGATSGGLLQIGSTFSLYGIKAQPAYTIKATGGNISYGADGYVYHSFLSDGNFIPSQSLSCDVLVVAGGGGAGYGANAGGGGAGGYLQGTMNLTATTYPVVIGNGGTTSYPSEGLGGGGGNTTFNGATALGGGAGSGNSNVNGSNGGSGGGGGYNPPSTGLGGSATQGNSGGLTGFGNAGGTGGTIRSGGGAGSAGGDPNNGAFGAGKVWLNGVTYASGGNRLTSGPATPAVPNSGRGGDQGSVGSSGIVIVRYLG